MLAKKRLMAAIFSIALALAMTAIPGRAFADGWGHDGGYRGWHGGEGWHGEGGWNRGWRGDEGWRGGLAGWLGGDEGWRGGERWRGGLPGWLGGEGWRGRGDDD